MRRIAVLGLGYVGLPVAAAFARRFPGTLGYDSEVERVRAIADGNDPSGQLSAGDIRSSGLRVTADAAELAQADFQVVCVPTPIDAHKRPDLGPLLAAMRTVGATLARGDLVVVESTVYPGVTEEVCGPVLEAVSGLRSGVDFKLGYSPERINPGDPEHSFERVRKVVAGQDAEALEVVAECYGAVVEAGVHRAPSIQVAEAAKVIENVQRDLNIALMNELAIVFDRLGIDTRAVLDAAATKWNFHSYRPGLVGGHCIGVDPYYLTSKAEEVGLHTQVILAGRRINDGMGGFVAAKAVKLLAREAGRVRGARVAVLGMTFKEGIADVRNSQVPGIVSELADHGVEVLVHDPLANPAEVARAYGIELEERASLSDLDAILLAVAHPGLPELALELAGTSGARLVLDVTWRLDESRLPRGVGRWRL